MVSLFRYQATRSTHDGTEYSPENLQGSFQNPLSTGNIGRYGQTEEAQRGEKEICENSSKEGWSEYNNKSFFLRGTSRSHWTSGYLQNSQGIRRVSVRIVLLETKSSLLWFQNNQEASLVHEPQEAIRFLQNSVPPVSIYCSTPTTSTSEAQAGNCRCRWVI